MIAYTDGATYKTNNGDAPIGAGVVITSDDGEVIDTLCVPLGIGTSNMAEYLAIIEAFEWAIRAWLDGETLVRFDVRADSQLVVRQVKGHYGVFAPQLVPLHERVRHLRKLARRKAGIRTTLKWIPREENKLADKISKEAAWLSAQAGSDPAPSEGPWTGDSTSKP